MEFHAVKPDVEDLLAKGHPMTSVYRLLKENGKISMCFESFKRYLRGPRRKKMLGKEASAASSSQSAYTRPTGTVEKEPKTVSASPAKTSDSMPQKRGPIIVKAEQKGFGQDKISLEDLI